MLTKKHIQTNSHSIYTIQSSIARKLRATLTILDRIRKSPCGDIPGRRLIYVPVKGLNPIFTRVIPWPDLLKKVL
jgi:hypothetical protein